jgi:hypothetical protein
VPTPASFDYAVLRVVPRVERQEFLNTGVIILCRERRYLQAKVMVDEVRLRALWPLLEIEAIRQHADAIVRICAGDSSADPIAALSQSERFHWLTSPRSTMMQSSPVHTGICHDTQALLDRLYAQMVG